MIITEAPGNISDIQLCTAIVFHKIPLASGHNAIRSDLTDMYTYRKNVHAVDNNKIVNKYVFPRPIQLPRTLTCLSQSKIHASQYLQ
jgi:hypothetical protein